MLLQRQVYRMGAVVLLTAGLTSVVAVAHVDASSSRATLAGPMKKVLVKETNNRYHYVAPNVTVAKGTTVTWTNKTDVEHNVTLNNGPKVNKDIKTGKTVSFTFTKAGTYKYHCEYHPYMKGTVVVK